jgi:glycosyltransferase involved in cell wall biosynthesis
LDNPKLSIITINFNNKKGLEKTIQSVISQTFDDYEYIIIDGGSKDGSKEVIERYADKIHYWVSEPDKGIYNAMNKGIKAAKGEYYLFLNSGDFLIEKETLNKIFSINPQEDIIYGDIIKIKDAIETYKAYPDEVNLETLSSGALPHQAMLFKSKLFLTYGLFNESNKIVSDWEYYTRLLLIYNISYRHLPFAFTYFDMTGLSNNIEWKRLHELEREKAKLGMFTKRVWRTADELSNLRRDYDGLLSSKSVLLALKLSKILKFWKRTLSLN